MNHEMAIMVVDDEPVSVRLLSAILSVVGYRIRPADSGELALASIAAEPPDLILLDICMPGLNGFEVCRRLKADPATHHIPVLFVSAVDEVEERIEGLRLGASDFVPKPIHREELLARVSIHLDVVRMRRHIGGQITALQQANDRAMAEIIERRRVEQTLRRSEEKFQRVFALNPAAISISRLADETILDVNAAWSQITGFTAAEAQGRTTVSLGLWAYPEEREAMLGEFRSSGKLLNHEIRLRSRCGTIVDVLCSAGVLRIQDESCMVLMAVDVTQTRRALRELLRSQDFLRTTSAMAKMGAWEHDVASGLQTWTEEVYRIHGIPLDQPPCLEECLARYVPASQQIFADAFRKAIGHGDSFDLELALQVVGDGQRLVHVVGKVQIEAGGVTKIVGTCQDITEIRRAHELLATAESARKRAEEALLTSERNAVIGRLAGRVAHEINNPLASIKAYIEPLRRRVVDRPEVDEGLGIIDRQVDRVARLARDLLDFERQRTPTRSPARLPVVLETVVALLRARAENEGKHLEASIPGDLPVCTMDTDQIQQVLINLLENAFDAVASGALVQVRAHASDRGVEVEVLDDGPGLGPDVERLFIPFVSTKEKGCGLGLSLARRICEAHGGWLRGGNRPEGGARMHFWLPVDPGAQS